MTLRLLTESDLALVLKWRNAPEVRSNMHTIHEISKSEHAAWFERMEQDRQSRWYIYVDSSGNPAGVVYFTKYQLEHRSAFWGFYVGSTGGKGVGTKMLYEALEFAFTELEIHKLNSEVLASNVKSIDHHRKYGFTEEGRFRDFHFDGTKYIDVVRLGILESEWVDRRNEVLKRVEAIDEFNGKKFGM